MVHRRGDQTKTTTSSSSSFAIALILASLSHRGSYANTNIKRQGVVDLPSNNNDDDSQHSKKISSSVHQLQIIDSDISRCVSVIEAAICIFADDHLICGLFWRHKHLGNGVKQHGQQMFAKDAMLQCKIIFYNIVKTQIFM